MYFFAPELIELYFDLQPTERCIQGECRESRIQRYQGEALAMDLG